MLVLKILKKDFLRKKSTSIVVFSFIMLSALLSAGGSNLIVELTNSLDSLFVKTDAPHFVQMHSGDTRPGQSEIDRFSADNSLVEEQQTVEMITIDGSALYLGESLAPEEGSIMDISFIKQNRLFDFLLDMENRVLDVSPGEIAVPVYYMQQHGLETGDKVRLKDQAFEKTFIISDFSRDSMMNPSVIHSKRFLVHNDDYEVLAKQFHEREYLIEFKLNDLSRLGEFADLYQSSGLPAKGPAVDHSLFKVLNAMTDGITAVVIIFLSIILMVIAVLCLRFIIIAAIEEDNKEIGVMKAIGISKNDIKRIYLFKYAAAGILASLCGYIASLFLNQFLLSNIMLYAGRSPKSLTDYIVPVIASGIIAAVVVLSCLIILRRFNRINAVEALRGTGGTGGMVLPSAGRGRLMSLKTNKILELNVFIGFRDVFQRLKTYSLLFFVFFLCACFVLIPVHFLSTIKSSAFISYMGIGQCDIRIDLRQSEKTAERFESMSEFIADDADIERYSPMITSGFAVLQDDGSTESISIETGDFSVFPLEYLEGKAPAEDSDIALSYLNSRDMEKNTGDSIVLLIDGQEKEMTVSGIYQDVTNGGRTAKAVLPFNSNNVMWYTAGLDLKPGISIEEKIREYSDIFHPARVTDLESYLEQTLGNTIEQLEKVTIIAVLTGLFVSVLITSLFLKMMISGDYYNIAVMKSLGFSLYDIRLQYLSKSLLVLGLGIAAGTVFSNTMGEDFVSFLWSFMGASQIRFVIDKVQAYIVFPVLLMTAVSITTILSISGIRDTSITGMITE